MTERGKDGETHWANFEPAGLRIACRAGIGRRSQWLEASQIRLNRTVALKCLRPFLAEREAFRHAFFEAGRLAAAIVHPAALPIFDVYARENCIAMQWCGGQPLRETEAAFTPRRVLEMADAVMDCLAGLHATGRCHGNLGPGNIFLGERRAVWLDDFFQPPVMVDGDRLFMGDQRFIAPEVLTGGAPDWRSDLFSLGRLMDFVAGPEAGSPEMRGFAETLRASDPSERGRTPVDIHQDIKRLLRLEELREGGGNDAGRHRRMYRRIPADFEVSLRRRSATPVETQTILMKTRDIGESGVFVETSDELLVVGSIVELNFTLKGVEGHVHAFGVIRWRSQPPLTPGVGVQFVEVDQAGLARLREYVAKRSHE